LIGAKPSFAKNEGGMPRLRIALDKRAGGTILFLCAWR
jgi:hypothetical protein